MDGREDVEPSEGNGGKVEAMKGRRDGLASGCSEEELAVVQAPVLPSAALQRLGKSFSHRTECEGPARLLAGSSPAPSPAAHHAGWAQCHLESASLRNSVKAHANYYWYGTKPAASLRRQYLDRGEDQLRGPLFGCLAQLCHGCYQDVLSAGQAPLGHPAGAGFCLKTDQAGYQRGP